MNESQLKQPNAKLDSSFRNQERAMADQMLADDLKRARAIRTAALEAKNNRGGQRTYDGSTHDSTVGWSRQHQFNATTDTTAASLSNRHNHNHTASIAANMSSALPPEFHQSQSIKYQFANNNTIAGDAMQTFSGTGVVSNAMVDENKMLRDRVNAKSSEVFELRRQVDKAMQQLREKDRVCSALQQDVKNKQREIDEHQRRLVESQTQIERLHDIMNRVREEDDELHRKHAAGENRMLKLESKIRQLEDALEEADALQVQTATDCEFRLNLIEESKQTLTLEGDQRQEELQAFACELRDGELKVSELEEMIRNFKMEKALFEEEKEKLGQKTKEWHDEAERLRRVVDEKNRLNFEMRGDGDSKAKSMMLQIHELQSAVAALDVDKNTLAANKLDLTHEVNRLMRRAEEREEQVKRLLRHLEEKDQQIAELGPAMKEAKRASAMALSDRKKKSGSQGWRH